MNTLDTLRARFILILIFGAVIAAGWLYYRFSVVIPGDYFSFSEAGTTLSQATIPLLIVMITNLFVDNRPNAHITPGQELVAYVIIILYSCAIVLGVVFDAHYLEIVILPWVISLQALVAAPIAYIFGKANATPNA